MPGAPMSKKKIETEKETVFNRRCRSEGSIKKVKKALREWRSSKDSAYWGLDEDGATVIHWLAGMPPSDVEDAAIQEAIERAIRDGIDLEARLQRSDGKLGAKALHWAARMGSIGAIRALIKAGVELSEDEQGSPIAEALDQGNVEAVELLLEAGAQAREAVQTARARRARRESARALIVSLAPMETEEEMERLERRIFAKAEAEELSEQIKPRRQGCVEKTGTRIRV